MSLLSPQLFHFKNTLVATRNTEYTIDENNDGVLTHGIIFHMFFGEEELAVDTYAGIIVPSVEINSVMINEYEAFKTRIGRCVSNAEILKDQVLQINLLLFTKYSDDNKRINMLDFMKLKDNFCDFLKKHPQYKHLANKQLRRDFNQFIIDRNIYTHGQLKIRQRDNQFIIDYIDNHSKIKTYAIVTEEILSSYQQTYLELKNLTRVFIELYNNNNNNSYPNQ